MLPPGLDTPTQVKKYYEQQFNTLIESGRYSPFVYPWASLGAAVVLAYVLLDHRTSSTLQALRRPAFALLFASSAWSVLNLKARSAAGAYGVGITCSFGTLWTAALIFFNDCQTDFKRIQRGESKDGEEVVERGKKIPHLFWQPYPARPFSARLGWLADLFINVRGVGWSFQTTGIPPVPASAGETTVSFTGIQRFSSRPRLLRYVVTRLVMGFLLLDLIKTVMNHDPYFWGYVDADPPSWLPHPIASSSILVRCYRSIVSCAGIVATLNEIFHLEPLFFTLLTPRYAGLRGEAWMQAPDYWGNISLVMEKGLAGWWGAFWHQTFRFAFEVPSVWVVDRMGVNPKSQLGKVVALFVSFSLSGCLHACGSYTQLGDTRPFRGPFCFFIAQAVGITIQMVLSRRAHIGMPRMIRRGTNLLFVMIWLYVTAPLLVDDFARGGIWLYEPIAFSPLQALGFGTKDDTRMNLWYGLVYWRRGDHWWDTGIGF